MKKRAKVLPGDIFAIRLNNGKLALGQVVEEWMPRVICIALFDRVIEKCDEFAVDDLGSLISLPSVATAEISGGCWKKLANAPVRVDARFAPHRGFESQRFIGATWSSGKIIEDFLNAYHGLASWEPYAATPGRLKAMLLSNDHKTS